MNVARFSFEAMAEAYPPLAREDTGRARINPGEITLLTSDDLHLAPTSSLRNMIEREAGPDGDRSKHALRTVGDMVRAGYSDEAILGVMLNEANAVSGHIFAQADPERAARRAVERVRGDAAGSTAGDSGAGAKAQREGGEEVPFALTDAADWDGLPTPRREWLVALHILPATVNGLYGEGAVGKSLAAQQLCTSLAAGVSFLGLAVAQCNAAYLTAEDDIAELQIRQADICTALNIKHGDLRGRLHLGSLIDERDKALMRPAGRHSDRLLPTLALRRLRATITALQLRCVALDNIGHFFGGNEIAREDVVAFLGELNAIARELDCAIILIGHPNKAGAAYSGSTAWQNQVRMQLVLTRPDRDGDPNMRELRREKANYGPPGEAIRVLWHHGAFVLEDQVPADDAQRVNAAMLRQSEIFYACLDEVTAQERAASVSKNAGNYAPKLFATLPPVLKRGMKPEDFERVMNHLLAAGMLETGPLPWRTSSRNAATGLRRKQSVGGGDDTPM